MRALVPLVLLLAGLAGCTAPAATLDGAVDADLFVAALCGAADADVVVGARSSFAAAHDGLHTLARDLQDVDERAAAARLLEAKQRVEAAVAEELPLSDLGPRIDDLVAAVATATNRLDRPTPTCD